MFPVDLLATNLPRGSCCSWFHKLLPIYLADSSALLSEAHYNYFNVIVLTREYTTTLLVSRQLYTPAGASDTHDALSTFSLFYTICCFLFGTVRLLTSHLTHMPYNVCARSRLVRSGARLHTPGDPATTHLYMRPCVMGYQTLSPCSTTTARRQCNAVRVLRSFSKVTNDVHI